MACGFDPTTLVDTPRVVRKRGPEFVWMADAPNRNVSRRLRSMRLDRKIIWALSAMYAYELQLDL